jgi:hypothetical protein
VDKRLSMSDLFEGDEKSMAIYDLIYGFEVRPSSHLFTILTAGC